MSQPIMQEEELRRRIAVLEEFSRDIRDWFTGPPRDELRSKISRQIRGVRDLVREAGCMKLYAMTPPPALGGLIQRDIDPFASLFHDFWGMSLIPKVIDIIDETIGVMQSPGYLDRIASKNSDSETARNARSLQRAERLCRRFPLVARQLQARYNDRLTLSIDDEYDVQDVFHALLRIDFDDVRREEWTPSYAGGSSRMDFLLKAEKIVIEIKKTRHGLGARDVGAQLIVDIERYRGHPDCRSLLCFVYDPEFRLGNPAGLEGDLTRRDEDLEVRIIIAPSDK